MQLRLLLDEDTERELATKLQQAGHDVERVVTADRLGTGATDDEVRAYARKTDRRLLTHDDDHLVVPTNQHAGVLYAPEQRLSAFQLFRIVQAVAETIPDQNEIPPVVFLTDDWI